LTELPPITPTLHPCPSAWQPNPGRRSTYRRGKSVQTTGTTSVCSDRPVKGSLGGDQGFQRFPSALVCGVANELFFFGSQVEVHQPDELNE